LEPAFECEIEIIELTDSIGADLTKEFAELCCFALDSESSRDGWTVTLVFTDDEHLTRLHDKFMGIPEPTDIITFPDDEQLGGDVVISVEQADRQRIDDRWSLDDELRFLVVHGALHLAGWDDQTPELRSAMLERQRAIIQLFQKLPSNRR
jgi:probable rRNA maturation factor